MLIAVDFDGVIHDDRHPVPGKRLGLPFPEAAAALEALTDEGHTVVIHTVKAKTQKGREAVEDWLDHYGITDYSDITAIKPNADLFIDDKGYRHTNWQETLAFCNVDMV